MWGKRKEERGSGMENTADELRNLVLISDPVYNMSINKSFHILMSFVCSLPSLKSIYRFAEFMPDTGNV